MRLNIILVLATGLFFGTGCKTAKESESDVLVGHNGEYNVPHPYWILCNLTNPGITKRDRVFAGFAYDPEPANHNKMILWHNKGASETPDNLVVNYTKATDTYYLTFSIASDNNEKIALHIIGHENRTSNMEGDISLGVGGEGQQTKLRCKKSRFPYADYVYPPTVE